LSDCWASDTRKQAVGDEKRDLVNFFAQRAPSALCAALYFSSYRAYVRFLAGFLWMDRAEGGESERDGFLQRPSAA